jgi:hypothetical protein
LQNGAAAPKNDFHDDYALDLEALVEEAKCDFADPEALKNDADWMGYYYMSNHENVTASERHAVFGAIGAAKAKIDATSPTPAQPTPQRNHGSDEVVEDGPRVYIASSMGDALVQAFAETGDESFEMLLGQWQRIRDKESAERTPDSPVQSSDLPSRPALHPAHRQTAQAILEAVEIKEF